MKCQHVNLKEVKQKIKLTQQYKLIVRRVLICKKCKLLIKILSSKTHEI